MPIPMVTHSELVITVLPRDENTVIKNYLEENMTISKVPPCKPVPSKTSLYLQFVT